MRKSTWGTNTNQFTFTIYYGPTNSIPSFPKPPPARVWLLTEDGNSIPPDNYFLFVGIARFGQISYIHALTFSRNWPITNAVALVVGIETNFVVESILEPKP